MLKSRFFLVAALLLGLSFFILCFVFPVGGKIDLYLIQPWVSPFGEFALKQDWYLATLNHRYVKDVLIVVYLTFLVLWMATFKVEQLKAKRWQYGYLFWISMLCTCVVSLIKAQAAHACPICHVVIKGIHCTRELFDWGVVCTNFKRSEFGIF